MTFGGSEVVRAFPPVPPGPDHVTTPIRFEKRWLEGLSFIKLGVAVMLLLPFIFLLAIIASWGPDPTELLLVALIFGPMILPLVLYIVVLVLRTRPAAFEMDGYGVRLYRDGQLVKELAFGPDVEVGVVTVGYWDDMSPGLTGRVVGMDENDVSLFDRRGFGPLFGFRFRGGGKKVVVSRRHGWDLRWIQWMWVPVMNEVGRHRMRMDRSMLRYLDKRRRMGLPVP